MELESCKLSLIHCIPDDETITIFTKRQILLVDEGVLPSLVPSIEWGKTSINRLSPGYIGTFRDNDMARCDCRERYSTDGWLLF